MSSAYPFFIISKEQDISSNSYKYMNPVNAQIKAIRGNNIVMFFIIITRGLQRDINVSLSDTPARRL